MFRRTLLASTERFAYRSVTPQYVKKVINRQSLKKHLYGIAYLGWTEGLRYFRIFYYLLREEIYDNPILEMLRFAAANGHIPLLKEIEDFWFEAADHQKIANTASEWGQLRVVLWTRNRISKAEIGKHLPQFHEDVKSYIQKTIADAQGSFNAGFTDGLLKGLNHGFECGFKIGYFNRHDTQDYDTTMGFDYGSAFYCAVRNHQLRTALLSLNMNRKHLHSSIRWCVEFDNLQFLKLLKHMGELETAQYATISKEAARYGRVRILRWAMKNRATPETIERAKDVLFRLHGIRL